MGIRNVVPTWIVKPRCMLFKNEQWWQSAETVNYTQHKGQQYLPTLNRPLVNMLVYVEILNDWCCLNTYRKGTAEELPFPDGSVDLLTAASAAHWFDQQRFLLEAGRVLKPCGCMALLGFADNFRLHYGSCGDRLTSMRRWQTDLEWHSIFMVTNQCHVIGSVCHMFIFSGC